MFIPAFVLLSQLWLSTIFGISWGLLFYRDVVKEEQGNIAKFGGEYLRYMDRVPRMNPVAGALRLFKGEKGGSRKN